MAFPIQNLPDYTVMDAASYKAAIDSVSANYARRAGGLNVEVSATPAMNVRVTAGSYFSSSANVLTEVAAATTSIGAAPSSPNNRIDRVVYNTATLAVQVIAGSASPTPSAPSIPANCITLAKVQVNHGTKVPSPTV